MINLTNTEKRLIVLYILSKLKRPISNESLAKLIIDTTSLKWFDVQITLDSLIKDHLVEKIEEKIEISTEGVEVISQYHNEILLGIRQNIDEYLINHFDQMSDFSKITANFKKVQNGYLVNLSLSEMDEKLIEITLSVPTRELADKICSNFKKKTIQIYRQIISIL